jgi:hypothetical protein
VSGGSKELLVTEAIFVPAANPQGSLSGTGLETEATLSEIHQKECKKVKIFIHRWAKQKKENKENQKKKVDERSK